MRIALDYDNTYTLDQGFWRTMIDIGTRQGHDIRCVTARSATEDRTAGIIELEEWLPIIYCNGVAKEAVCQYLEWVPDVWIDDKARSITHNSPSTPEQLQDWRLTRGEGPSIPKKSTRGVRNARRT